MDRASHVHLRKLTFKIRKDTIHGRCYWTMGFDLSGQEARKASRVNSSFSETLWERNRIIS